MKRASLLLFLLTLAFAAAACSAPPRPPEVQATIDALSTAAVATVSARLEGGAVSQTPEPILGDTQVAGAEVGGPSESEISATRDAFPYLGELTHYGVDPNQGRPGWIHPPVTLEAQGPNGFRVENQFASTVAADFVISADITWDTQFAESGCGFILRADGNRNAPDQYILGLTRFAGGHVYFAVQAEGQVVGEQDRYARGADPAFKVENGSTNRLTVVARGSRIQVWTNGVLVGEFDPNQPPTMPPLPPPPAEPEDRTNPEALAAYLQAKAEHEVLANQIRARHNERLRAFQSADKTFERGFTALVALAQNGAARCTFENAWLWMIEE